VSAAEPSSTGDGIPESVLAEARAFARAGGILALKDWRRLSAAERLAHAAARDEMRALEAYGLVRILRDALFPPPSLDEVMREGAKIALTESKGITE
jgi:hypothetical protein